MALPNLFTAHQLGRALGLDGRTAAKRYEPVASLKLGEKMVPLYKLPTTK